MADLEDELQDDERQRQSPLIGRIPPTQPGVAVRGLNLPTDTGGANAAEISPSAAPSADLETRAAGIPAEMGASLRGATQPDKPSALETKTSQDEAAQQRLSKGSGISQIGNPWARGALRGLNIAGSILAPNIMTRIPGTEEHHQELVGQNQHELAEDAGQAKTQAETSEAQQRGEQAAATADKDRSEVARAGEPKPKEEKWDAFAGFTDTDGTPLIREENSGQVVRASDHKPATGFMAVKPAGFKTREITRVVSGVPHTVMVDAETGEDVKDEGQTKVPGEAPGDKRAANESAQVERESRTAIRKAEEQYRGTLQSVNQMKSSIDAAKDGNGLLTSFVPTMEVLGINASNGVHRISPAEAQAANLPGGWAERFNAYFDKASTGKLSPQLQAEGKQLADILAKTAHKRYSDIYKDEASIVSGYGGQGFEKRVPLIPEEGGQQQPTPVYVNGKIAGYTTDGKTMTPVQP